MGTPGPPLLRVGDNAAAADPGKASRSDTPLLLRLAGGAPSHAMAVLPDATSLRHASRAGVNEAGAVVRVQNQREGWAAEEAPAGSDVGIVEEERANGVDEEDIALEDAIVGVVVWRGLAVPWHQSKRVRGATEGLARHTTPWTGYADQVAQGAATSPPLRPCGSSFIGRPGATANPGCPSEVLVDRQGFASTNLRAKRRSPKRHSICGLSVKCK